MLQPHSVLWHYLWLGPHVLQAGLAVLLWRRQIFRAFPVFFCYLLFEAAEEFTLYAMDLLPSVSVSLWWFAFCAGVVLEGTLSICVLWELLFHLVGFRPSIKMLSGRLMLAVNAALILLAVVAAAYAPMSHPQHLWTYRSHVLLQSFYIVEGGLALFLFVFVAYTKLSWSRYDFGVALGFGILFCEHMATWSIMATGALPYSRFPLLDFLNMATYHICVLIWCYYLLIPQKKPITSAADLPENNLAAWNRELERLIER
jgi:hypothetical protein